MDFAIRVLDGELVFAEDYLDTNESPLGFCCPYPECEINLRLKAYSSENKVSPYFAPEYKYQPHTEKCFINNKKTIKTTNGINNSIPISYKNLLILKDNSCSENTINSKNTITNNKPNNKPFHNRTSKHIAAIVRWYLQNPTEGYRDLKIPGYTCGTYQSIFQEIYTFSQDKYKGTHIFFGKLLFNNYFEEKNNQIIFNIYQYNSHESIKLIVNTNDWNNSSKKLTLNLVKRAIKKSKEAFKANIKGVYTYIFFLGNVDEISRRVFYCNNHSAIFSMAIENLYLPSDDCGLCTSLEISTAEKSLDKDVETFNKQNLYKHDQKNISSLKYSEPKNLTESISKNSEFLPSKHLTPIERSSSESFYQGGKSYPNKAKNTVRISSKSNKSKSQSSKVIKKYKLDRAVKNLFKSLLKSIRKIEKYKFIQKVRNFLNVFNRC